MSVVLDTVLDMKALIEDRNCFPAVSFSALLVGLILGSLLFFDAGLESSWLSIADVGVWLCPVSTFISLLPSLITLGAGRFFGLSAILPVSSSRLHSSSNADLILKFQLRKWNALMESVASALDAENDLSTSYEPMVVVQYM